MKKIGFLVLPEKGHVNPTIGPAQILQSRGHQVIFAAAGDISRQLTLAGLSFDKALISSEPSVPMRGRGLVELIRDRTAMENWIRCLLIPSCDEEIQRKRAWIRNQRTDLVVLDPLDYSGSIACDLEGCPWVSMSNSLNPILEPWVQSDLLDIVDDLSEDRLTLFHRFGLCPQFRGCDRLSPYLNLAFCTEAFVGPRNENEVRMVGPSTALFQRGDQVHEWGGKKAKSLVYCSFGSQIYHWPEVFAELIDSLRDKEIHLVLSVGDLVKQFQSSSWLTVYDYAPQERILKDADLFITHGGANSVMEALTSGVPMWVSPMCNDQFHQAQYVAKSQVGISRDITNMKAVEIRSQVGELLSDQALRQRVESVAQSYRLNNGSMNAADAIENLMREIST